MRTNPIFAMICLVCLAGSCATDDAPVDGEERDSGFVEDAGSKDGGADVGTDTGPNRAPTAVIDAPGSASVDELVELSAADSTDPDGDALDFFWTFLDKPADSEATLTWEFPSAPQFTVDAPGDYELELRVSDGELEDTTTATIAVDDNNNTPTADAGPDQTVEVGTEVTLDASGSFDIEDPNGELGFGWAFVSDPSGGSDMLSNPDDDRTTFTPSEIGEYELVLTVTDTRGLEDIDQISVTAHGPNEPPTADAGTGQTANLGQAVTLDGTSSSDPDGDTLSYEWSLLQRPAGSVALLEDHQSAQPSLTPDAVGDYTVQLIVDDGVATASATVTITAIDSTSFAGCLIISEYVEGSSFNKAVELFNCGTSDIDLGPLAYCAAHNATDPTSADSCSADHDLVGTLPAGDTLVVCHTSFEDRTLCDVETGSVSFNGDDRFVIYADDGSGQYEHGTDSIVDAFGQLGTEPADDTWADMTLDRCNFTPYDAASSFDATTYFGTPGAEDDFSGLGVAPSESCAP